MKYAICNETFVDWPFDKACAFSRECGYTGIEIAPFTFANDVKDIDAAKRAEIKQQAADAGLEVVGLHWLLAKTEGYYLTSPDVEVRSATAEYMKELARCCRDVGGTILVFGSPLQRNLKDGVTEEQGMEYAADVFRAAMPVLEECGVTLALEPLGPGEGNFLNTAADGVKLMGMIGSPNCKLHLDCKAMSTESQSVADVVRANSEAMVHFHANDPNKLGPGFGELDFVPIMQALVDVNYDGWVSVEVFDYSPGPETLAKQSIDNLKAALAKTSQ